MSNSTTSPIPTPTFDAMFDSLVNTPCTAVSVSALLVAGAADLVKHGAGAWSMQPALEEMVSRLAAGAAEGDRTCQKFMGALLEG